MKTRTRRPGSALARVLRSVQDPGERRWLRGMLVHGVKAGEPPLEEARAKRRGKEPTRQPPGRPEDNRGG